MVRPSLELFIVQRSEERRQLKSRDRNRRMNRGRSKTGAFVVRRKKEIREKRGGFKPQTDETSKTFTHTHTLKTHSDSELSTSST